MTGKLIAEDFSSSTKDNDEIDIGKIFRLLLMQSKFIILNSLLNTPKCYILLFWI